MAESTAYGVLMGFNGILWVFMGFDGISMIIKPDFKLNRSKRIILDGKLVGGWLNPSEKYESQWDDYSQYKEK